MPKKKTPKPCRGCGREFLSTQTHHSYCPECCDIDRVISRTTMVGECRVWTGPVSPHGGYALIRVPGERGGKRVHRLVWEHYNGPIPKDMRVLHTCDNPACVNIEHLWLGTQLENIADRVAKGRSSAPRGESSPVAKLSEENVRDIHRRLWGGERGVDLSKEFGVTTSTIAAIRLGKAWRHLGLPPLPRLHGRQKHIPCGSYPHAMRELGR